MAYYHVTESTHVFATNIWRTSFISAGRIIDRLSNSLATYEWDVKLKRSHNNLTCFYRIWKGRKKLVSQRRWEEF